MALSVKSIELVNLKNDGFQIDTDLVEKYRDTIFKDLNNIINDVDGIKKAYKQMEADAGTKGEYKTIAAKVVKKAETYNKNLSTTKSKMSSNLADSLLAYVDVFVKGAKTVSGEADKISTNSEGNNPAPAGIASTTKDLPGLTSSSEFKGEGSAEAVDGSLAIYGKDSKGQYKAYNDTLSVENVTSKATVKGKTKTYENTNPAVNLKNNPAVNKSNNSGSSSSGSNKGSNSGSASVLQKTKITPAVVGGSKGVIYRGSSKPSNASVYYRVASDGKVSSNLSNLRK